MKIDMKKHIGTCMPMKNNTNNVQYLKNIMVHRMVGYMHCNVFHACPCVIYCPSHIRVDFVCDRQTSNFLLTANFGKQNYSKHFLSSITVIYLSSLLVSTESLQDLLVRKKHYLGSILKLI